MSLCPSSGLEQTPSHSRKGVVDIGSVLPVPPASQPGTHSSSLLSCTSDFPILLFLQEKNSQQPNHQLLQSSAAQQPAAQKPLQVRGVFPCTLFQEGQTMGNSAFRLPFSALHDSPHRASDDPWCVQAVTCCPALGYSRERLCTQHAEHKDLAEHKFPFTLV